MLAFYLPNVRRLYGYEVAMPSSTVSEDKMLAFYPPNVRRLYGYEVAMPSSTVNKKYPPRKRYFML